ncbi:MAG: hypothetical protein HYV90_02190 [Candidatus Woesebacteria bacterium]|nr:MAG: hypothetical protein HYV90_02190 [Candidatus Woesebacteria bacterium]
MTNRIRVLFIHHSTGGLLIYFGKIRKLLKKVAPNIEFWDHGYDLYPSFLLSKILGRFTFRTGLTDGRGKMVGKDFKIVISNNSPKEYADIFNRSPEDFTLGNILKFDIVIFKNCFPTSKIETKEKLEEYKRYYSLIIQGLSRFPNKFVIFTPPPLRHEVTKPEWAENARELSVWLASQKQKNLAVFNFFDLLADKTGKNTNMLKREYCSLIPVDSHPNIRANKAVGKIFVDFLINEVPSL